MPISAKCPRFLLSLASRVVIRASFLSIAEDICRHTRYRTQFTSSTKFPERGRARSCGSSFVNASHLRDRRSSITEPLWADFGSPLRDADEYITSLRRRRMNIFPGGADEGA